MVAEGLVIDIEAKDDATDEIRKVRREAGKLDKSVGKMGKSTGKLNKSSAGLTSSLGGLAGAAAGVTTAFAAVAQVTDKAIKAQREQAKLTANLRSQLKRTGLTTTETEQAMRRLNAEMARNQERTLFGDEAQQRAMSRILAITGETTDSIRLLNLSLDAAQFSSRDAADAAKALAEAHKGDLGPLKELGLLTAEQIKRLNKIKDPTERAAEAFKLFEDRIKGARNEVDGQSQAIARLENDLGDVEQAYGDLSLSVLEFASKLTGLSEEDGALQKIAGALTTMSDAVDSLNDALDRMDPQKLKVLQSMVSGQVANMLFGTGGSMLLGSSGAALDMIGRGASAGGGGDEKMPDSAAGGAIGRRAGAFGVQALAQLNELLAERNAAIEQANKDAEALAEARARARRNRLARFESELAQTYDKRERIELKYHRRLEEIRQDQDLTTEERRAELLQAQRERLDAISQMEMERFEAQQQRLADGQIQRLERETEQIEKQVAARERLVETHKKEVQELMRTRHQPVDPALEPGDDIRGQGDLTRTRQRAGIRGGAAGVGAAAQFGRSIDATDEQTKALKRQLEVVGQLSGGVGDLAGNFEGLSESNWNVSKAQDSVISGMDTLTQMGGQLASAMTESTKEQAIARGSLHAAAAIGATALAISTGNPQYIGAAAKHGAASASFFAIAGRSGKGSTAGAGAGGRAGAGAAGTDIPRTQADFAREREASAQAFAEALRGANGAAMGVTINVDMGESVNLESSPQTARRIADAVGNEMRNRGGRG